jgi:hypothetical protein
MLTGHTEAVVPVAILDAAVTGGTAAEIFDAALKHDKARARLHP